MTDELSHIFREIVSSFTRLCYRDFKAGGMGSQKGTATQSEALEDTDDDCTESCIVSHTGEMQSHTGLVLSPGGSCERRQV